MLSSKTFTRISLRSSSRPARLIAFRFPTSTQNQQQQQPQHQRELRTSSLRMSNALLPYKEGQALTLSNQSLLPRFPIPALEASIAAYLKSLEPILLQKYPGDAKKVESEMQKRVQMGEKFLKEGGVGGVLQERLRDIDSSAPSNWLDDHFWLRCAYHSWRVPLIINSNWWILMSLDPNIPVEVRESVPAVGEVTEWQVRRAAKIVERLGAFKEKLDRQEILPDASRAGPFCMHQYTRIFGVTRLPQLPIDALVHTPHPCPASHITVILADNYFSLELTPNATTASIEASLWGIVRHWQTTLGGKRGDGVGSMSGASRDQWTKDREQLLSVSPVNRATITSIESSLFTLSLDAHTISSASPVSSSSTGKATPDIEAHILNACSGGGQGRNRWWDKSVGIAVESNGRCSVSGEHSPVDALIPAIVMEFVAEVGVEAASSTSSESGKGEMMFFKQLDWVVDTTTKSNIKRAEQEIEGMVGDSDAKMLWFDDYGIDWIKKIGKQSPDAYIQLALQLAFYKSHQKCVPTYETASTRLFLKGRTEVIRSFTSDGWRFVEAMRDRKESNQALYSLLTLATTTHNNLTRASSTGKGFDRHFMALKLLLRPEQDGKVDLFEDELFGESQGWILSTSGLSKGDKFDGTGFGTVWPEGYGINYLAGNSLLKFGIESKHSSPDSSTALFIKNLKEALREMKAVCELGQGAGGKL